MIYPDADTKRAKPWYTTITDAGIFLSCQATSYATKREVVKKNFYLSDSFIEYSITILMLLLKLLMAAQMNTMVIPVVF